jgi:hypothetical protein
VLSSGVLLSIRIGLRIMQRLLQLSRISGLRAGPGRDFIAKFTCIRVQLVERLFMLLHSYMTELEYLMEPPYNCTDDDVNDKGFVHATTRIGGHDAIEEFMPVKFGEVVEAKAPISKVVAPLPKFVATKRDGEGDEQFVLKVAERADKLVGRYTQKENQAYCA